MLAAASKWRARVVPPPKPAADSDDTNGGCSTCAAKDKPPTHRSGYRPWRELLMRSFKIDVDPPRLASARDPPYFKSQVIRRRLGAPAQAELFDAH